MNNRQETGVNMFSYWFQYGLYSTYLDYKWLWIRLGWVELRYVLLGWIKSVYKKRIEGLFLK